MPKQPCVYILASKCNGTLYVTSNLFWGSINDGPADIERQGVGRPRVEK